MHIDYHKHVNYDMTYTQIIESNGKDICLEINNL